MSTIHASNFGDGTNTVGSGYVINGSAKLWVNFNGSGTVAIRDNLNTSSITDRGTGSYTVNINSAMINSDYAFSSSCGAISSATQVAVSEASTGKTTSALAVYCSYSTSTLVDTISTYIVILGDLA